MAFRNVFVDTYDNKNAKSQKLWFITTLLYFLIFTAVQIKSNMNTTKEICGSSQWGPVMLWTLVPNILIFGSIIAILQNFPGWKAPFANTIGYGLLQFTGLKHLLNKILKNKITDTEDNTVSLKEDQGRGTDVALRDPRDIPGAMESVYAAQEQNPAAIGSQKVSVQSGGGISKGNQEISQLLVKLYHDPSLLINEITPANWDEWFEKTPIKKLFSIEFRTND